ncbi:MAG: hypothetical protein O2794_02070 [bacterium]|nr:hypothetical protein [bacterium]
MNKNELTEDILDKVLMLHDQGTSVSDILSMFPEYSGELKEIFATAHLLGETAKQIEPSLKLSGSIVTKLNGKRSIKEGSFVFPWRVVLPVGAMALLLVTVTLGQFRSSTVVNEDQTVAFIDNQDDLTKKSRGTAAPEDTAAPAISLVNIKLTVAEIDQEEQDIDFGGTMDDFFLDEFSTAEIDTALAEF